jgi:formiminoglutamase
VRPGELKVGQALHFLPNENENAESVTDFANRLEIVVSKGARYAIIGIPEDIGPRANMGRGGAVEAFPAFLKHFLNLQSNQYIKSEELCLIGHVKCDDLQTRSESSTLDELRGLVTELDDRVGGIMQAIFDAGLSPIIIGGGHNNCYPILKSLSTHCGGGVNAINLDPHADFRAIEGRHSGNGFSYAAQDGYLNQYHIMGLHELKNNQAILDSLACAKCTYDTYQSLFHRRSTSFGDALGSALETISSTDFGIELDLDSITGMPVSAYNECGITVDTAAQYVHQSAKNPKSRYLHLCEAAPQHHPAGLQAGEEATGQILAALATAFIQAKQF